MQAWLLTPPAPLPARPSTSVPALPAMSSAGQVLAGVMLGINLEEGDSRREIGACGGSQGIFGIKCPHACALKIKFSLPSWLQGSPSAGPGSCLSPPHMQGLLLVFCSCSSPNRCLELGLLRSCCPELGLVCETAGRSWERGQRPGSGGRVCMHLCAHEHAPVPGRETCTRMCVQRQQRNGKIPKETPRETESESVTRKIETEIGARETGQGDERPV